MPKPYLRVPRIACSVVMLLGVASQLHCGSDDPGSIIVPFELANSQSCAAFGVSEVEVTLVPSGDDIDEEVQVEVKSSAPCSDGEVMFTDIAVGQYRVLAQAIASDDSSVIVLDNVDDAIVTAEVLEGQETTATNVELGPAPAKLRLYWGLTQDGKQAMCSSVETTKFQVTAGATSTTSKFFEHEFNCDDPADDDLYRTAPDLERNLDGELTQYVQIQALNDAGEDVGAFMEVCFEPVGHGRAIEIDFECVDSACSITGDLFGSCNATP